MQDHALAIEIKSNTEFELALAIDPSISELGDFDELHNQFLVLDWPRPGETAIVPPDTFADHFDHIENGPSFTLKSFVFKK